MSFLTRTYPFKQSEHWLRDSLVYGIIVWAILYFLQPFGYSMYQGNKFLVAAIFGLVTLSCYALYGLAVVGPLNSRIKPWRIWHQASAILGLILFIAICNFLLFSLIFSYPIIKTARKTLSIFLFISTLLFLECIRNCFFDHCPNDQN